MFLSKKFISGYKLWLNTKIKSNVRPKLNVTFGKILYLNMMILMNLVKINFYKMMILSLVSLYAMILLKLKISILSDKSILTHLLQKIRENKLN